jgi:cell division protein FtsL
MPSYIQGNLALKETKRKAVTKAPEVVQQMQMKRSTLPAGEKLFYLLSVVFVVVLLGVVMMRYTMIYQLNTDIKQIQNEIKTVQEDGSALNQEVEMLGSPERLKEVAATQGFIEATDDQHIKIGLSNSTSKETKSAVKPVDNTTAKKTDTKISATKKATTSDTNSVAKTEVALKP